MCTVGYDKSTVDISRVRHELELAYTLHSGVAQRFF